MTEDVKNSFHNFETIEDFENTINEYMIAKAKIQDEIEETADMQTAQKTHVEKLIGDSLLKPVNSIKEGVGNLQQIMSGEIGDYGQFIDNLQNLQGDVDDEPWVLNLTYDAIYEQPDPTTDPVAAFDRELFVNERRLVLVSLVRGGRNYERSRPTSGVMRLLCSSVDDWDSIQHVTKADYKTVANLYAHLFPVESFLTSKRARILHEHLSNKIQPESKSMVQEASASSTTKETPEEPVRSRGRLRGKPLRLEQYEDLKTGWTPYPYAVDPTTGRGFGQHWQISDWINGHKLVLKADVGPSFSHQRPSFGRIQALVATPNQLLDRTWSSSITSADARWTNKLILDRLPRSEHQGYLSSEKATYLNQMARRIPPSKPTPTVTKEPASASSSRSDPTQALDFDTEDEREGQGAVFSARSHKKGVSRANRAFKLDKNGNFGQLKISIPDLQRLYLVASKDGTLVAEGPIKYDLYELLTKKYNARRKYSPASKEVFSKLVDLAGLPKTQGLSRKRSIIQGSGSKKYYGSNDELIKRFSVLTGSRKAGNINPEIVSEATEILDILKSKGVIDQQAYKQLVSQVL